MAERQRVSAVQITVLRLRKAKKGVLFGQAARHAVVHASRAPWPQGLNVKVMKRIYMYPVSALYLKKVQRGEIFNGPGCVGDESR